MSQCRLAEEERIELPRVAPNRFQGGGRRQPSAGSSNVGLARFERAASRPRTGCSTKLSHSPLFSIPTQKLPARLRAVRHQPSEKIERASGRGDVDARTRGPQPRAPPT